MRVSCSRDGWGEIAPLPGFSEETIEQAQEQVIEWLTNWCHASCEAPRVPLRVVILLLPSVLARRWMR